MKQTQVQRWVETTLAQTGGELLAIQTLRNAIMAASVIASVALIALMGVIAATPHMLKWVALSLAVLLACSVCFAIWTIVRCALFGFTIHLNR